MADAIAFESPVVKSYPTSVSDLTLRDESATTKIILRAAAGTAAAGHAEVAFGASRRDAEVLVCGQRPGEWMLLGEADAVQAMVNDLDRTGHVSLIDYTHSRALFRLTGAQSRSLLEKVCGLDWSDAMTPDGAVVSASVALVTCDITRQDDAGISSYLIACDRSFAAYLFDAILDAGAEFDITVTT